MTEELGGTSHI